MNRSKQVTVGADIEVFVARTEPMKQTPPSKKNLYGNKQNWPKDFKIENVTLTEISPVDTDGNPIDIDNGPGDLLHPELNISPDGLLNAETGQMEFKTAKCIQPKTQKSRVLVKNIIPCVGLIPGTKDKPFTPKDWPDGYAVQEDNVMLEFNIPPVKSPHALQNTMMTVRKLVAEICAEQNLAPIWNKPEHLFLPVDLTSSQATMFACDPDLDAYTGGTQRMAVPNLGCVRTCGGHIHLGGDFNCPDFVAVLFLELLMALYLGGQFIHDPNSARAKWYGRPGVFRIKTYGIEYRTLSNSWAASKYGTNDIAHIVFTIGNMLVETPANILQAVFRNIEWAELHDLLLNPYKAKMPIEKELTGDPDILAKASDAYHQYGQRWNELRRQVTLLNIPGLQL